MINAETIAWLRGSMNGKPATDAEIASALEALAARLLHLLGDTGYCPLPGQEDPVVAMAEAILGEEWE